MHQRLAAPLLGAGARVLDLVFTALGGAFLVFAVALALRVDRDEVRRRSAWASSAPDRSPAAVPPEPAATHPTLARPGLRLLQSADE